MIYLYELNKEGPILLEERNPILNIIKAEYSKTLNTLWTATISVPATEPCLQELIPLKSVIRLVDDYGEELGHYRYLDFKVSKNDNGKVVELKFYHLFHTMLDCEITRPMAWKNENLYTIIQSLLSISASPVVWNCTDETFKLIDVDAYEVKIGESSLNHIFELVKTYARNYYLDFIITEKSFNLVLKEIKEVRCRIKEGYNMSTFNIRRNAAALMNRVYYYSQFTEDEQQYLITMAEANGGKEYVEAVDSVDKYGIISKVICDTGMATPQELKNKAEQVLEKVASIINEIDCSVVDLVKASTDPISIDKIRLGNRVFFETENYGTAVLIISDEGKGDIFNEPQNITIKMTIDTTNIGGSSITKDIVTSIRKSVRLSEKAILSANGKNKNYFTETEPSDPQNGDVWYKELPDGSSEMYVFIGGAWVKKVSSDNSDILKKLNKHETLIAEAKTKAESAVQSDTLFEQINQNAGNVLIRAVPGGALLNITKDSVYMDNAIISQANIDLATITDALLKNVTFDWARGKTLDAAEINVINLNGKHISVDELLVNKLVASGLGESINLSSNVSIHQAVSSAVATEVTKPEIVEKLKGVGIKKTLVFYGISQNKTTQPTNWSTVIPEVIPGDYLWTKTVTEYTDDKIPVTEQLTYVHQPRDGDAVKIAKIEYKYGSSPSTPPDNEEPFWTPTVPDNINGQYLWTKVTYSSGDVSFSVSRQGLDGTPKFMWIMYADDLHGLNISNSPVGKSFVGYAYNKIQETPSNDPSHYNWFPLYNEQLIVDLQERTKTLEENTSIFESNISQLDNEVLETISKFSKYDGSLEALESSIRKSADDLRIEFNSVTDDLDGNIKKLSSWFDIGPNGVLIGKSGSPIMLHQTNDSIQFLENGVVTTEWKDNTMSVDNLIARISIEIGYHRVEKFTSPFPEIDKSTIIRQV